MCATIRFCILERIKDGRVVSIYPRVWSQSEAEEYVRMAASRGETYHAVPCEAKCPPLVGQQPTKRISFCQAS